MEETYITKDEYKKFWNLELVGEENTDFERNLIFAKEKIDSVTLNRIVAMGFDKLTKFQQEKVKMAMYYQIAYYEENGIEDDNVSSYSVLDISINVDKSTRSKAQRLKMSSFALDQLEKTGLCTRNCRWH